jgi:large subunit ribosomal protein L31
MKKGIHPNYHFVTVQLNDGTTYRTRTTWGEPDGKLTLDIDPSTHPAWTGGQQNLLDRGGRLTRFNKRFGISSRGSQQHLFPFHSFDQSQ